MQDRRGKHIRDKWHHPGPEKKTDVAKDGSKVAGLGDSIDQANAAPVSGADGQACR